MVSHFGFNLLFLVTDDAERRLVLADHVCVSSEDVSIKILCPRLNWVVCLFVVRVHCVFWLGAVFGCRQ